MRLTEAGPAFGDPAQSHWEHALLPRAGDRLRDGAHRTPPPETFATPASAFGFSWPPATTEGDTLALRHPSVLLAGVRYPSRNIGT